MSEMDSVIEPALRGRIPASWMPSNGRGSFRAHSARRGVGEPRLGLPVT